MTKSRPEYLSYLIVADTHPPSQARAAGSSVNMQEFHDAFGIRPGDPMWRDEADRVVIW
jgi:putative endopeptidase